MVAVEHLYEFAARAVRMATGTFHPLYVEHGYPVCAWCGTREWHRCPAALKASGCGEPWDVFVQALAEVPSHRDDEAREVDRLNDYANELIEERDAAYARAVSDVVGELRKVEPDPLHTAGWAADFIGNYILDRPTQE